MMVQLQFAIRYDQMACMQYMGKLLREITKSTQKTADYMQTPILFRS